jgi:hypothetical protein
MIKILQVLIPFAIKLIEMYLNRRSQTANQKQRFIDFIETMEPLVAKDARTVAKYKAMKKKLMS